MKKFFVKKLSTVAIAISLFGLLSPSVSAAVLGDNYPNNWRNAAPDSLVDNWAMYNRECTSFAAFRLSSANGFNLPVGYGNANTWGHIARRQGYQVDMNPAVGAIAWFDSYVGYSGLAGHVSWVANVNGDQVELEEYNYNMGQGSHRYSRRTIYKNQVSGFIHFKDIADRTNSSGIVRVSPSEDLANSGIYRFSQTRPVKAAASMSSQEVASYSAGQLVIYDKIVKADGYKWISYIGGSGLRRYVPVQRLALSNISPQPHAEVEVSNNNSRIGSFDVVVSGVSAPNGVSAIRVPVWSAEKSDTLVWYTADRQADGSYKVHVDSNAHKEAIGKYYIDVYAIGNDGKPTYLTGTTTDVSRQTAALPTGAKLEVLNQDRQTGSFDVVVSGISAPNGVSAIRVPVWSAEKSGTLVWYTADRQADGSYKVHVDSSAHKEATGKYYIDVYAIGNDGKPTYLTGTTTDVSRQTAALPTGAKLEVLNQDRQTGSFDVVVSGVSAPNGVSAIRVPVWSAEKSDTLVWYTADRQADGSYKVHVGSSAHKEVTGKYYIDVYAIGNDGKPTYLTGITTDVYRNKAIL